MRLPSPHINENARRLIDFRGNSRSLKGHQRIGFGVTAGLVFIHTDHGTSVSQNRNSGRKNDGH